MNKTEKTVEELREPLEEGEPNVPEKILPNY